MSIDDTVDSLFDARKKIFEHVGYRERWRDFPFEDSRAMFWAVRGHKVKFTADREALVQWLTTDDDSGEKYENEISDHAGESGIYRGIELTVIVSDTNTDGNVFLQIFRNMNEITLCSCGAMPQYVADDGAQRCRKCMYRHQVALHQKGPQS